MIEITPSLSIDESEIQLDFVRSSGPGGQNVNKVATAAQLRFDVRGSPSLPEDVKARLETLSGNRMTTEGVLIIEASQYRTQEQNRADALLRLIDLIRQATHKPKPRKKTRPGAAAVAKRLDEKRRRAEIKSMRKYRPKEPE
jgi:ribosome-associated protein